MYIYINMYIYILTDSAVQGSFLRAWMMLFVMNSPERIGSCLWICGEQKPKFGRHLDPSC